MERSDTVGTILQCENLIEPPVYTVDLRQAPEKRWQSVIEQESRRGRTLLACIQKAWLPNVESWKDTVQTLAKRWSEEIRLSRRTWTNTQRVFHDDMLAIAEGWKLSLGEVIFYNLAYELAHNQAQECRGRTRILGCTAVCMWSESQGWLHGRNLDWPIHFFGSEAIVIHYSSKAGAFTSVTWPGYVGILQGIAPGRFSVTINHAPSEGVTEEIPANFLLRDIFETCQTYEEAVDRICREPMGAACYFVVCGLRKADCVAIHAGLTEYSVREARRGVLVQSNRDWSNTHAYRNHLQFDCYLRYTTALEAVKKQKTGTPEALWEVLNLSPVHNADTVQQMIFMPKTGHCRLRLLGQPLF